MLPLIALLVMTQIPCVQGDSTAVCRCKQGSASGCAALDPRKAAEIAQALQVLKIDEEARQKQAASSAGAAVQESSDSPEPPDCKGQQHHVISKPIAKELELHPTLTGVYEPRDSRFVTRPSTKQHIAAIRIGIEKSMQRSSTGCVRTSPRPQRSSRRSCAPSTTVQT
ncbi:hypothetical protein BON30_41650 [Cystobacter ferrugineus]|uniref:Wall-associated protein n=1 Tax=Cystobacter ferrugineus TaxID=83449 RepID=A0A1L9AXC5_9BACT|nr:hypothetical protein BON30_41650 [Cystobacter ferrugineus]